MHVAIIVFHSIIIYAFNVPFFFLYTYLKLLYTSDSRYDNWFFFRFCYEILSITERRLLIVEWATQTKSISSVHCRKKIRNQYFQLFELIKIRLEMDFWKYATNKHFEFCISQWIKRKFKVSIVSIHAKVEYMTNNLFYCKKKIIFIYNLIVVIALLIQ